MANYRFRRDITDVTARARNGSQKVVQAVLTSNGDVLVETSVDLTADELASILSLIQASNFELLTDDRKR